MSDRIRVVIAEEREAASLCRELLEEEGFEVELIPRDGGKLLERIAEDRVDIVICNINLSRMDAIAVMRQAFAKEGPAPIFAVTSVCDRAGIERSAFEAGASLFFIKPFDANILAERVIGLVRKTRPEAVPQRDAEPEYAATICITEVMHRIGIPAHIKGYKYIREAVLLVLSNPDEYDAVTKTLYPDIAKKCKTTATRVERAIRHAIEVAWDRGDYEAFREYFGNGTRNRNGRPTNSEFIAMLAEHVQMTLYQRLG